MQRLGFALATVLALTIATNACVDQSDTQLSTDEEGLRKPFLWGTTCQPGLDNQSTEAGYCIRTYTFCCFSFLGSVLFCEDSNVKCFAVSLGACDYWEESGRCPSIQT